MIKNLIIRWLLAQLDTAVHSVDWAGLKAQVAAKVEAAIPFKIIDDAIELAVNETIDAIQMACADEEDLKSLLQHCADQNWDAALADLKAILAKVDNPTPQQVSLLAAL